MATIDISCGLRGLIIRKHLPSFRRIEAARKICFFLLLIWFNVLALFVFWYSFQYKRDCVFEAYASSRSEKISGTSWSLDDLLKSRLSSTFIHGCSKMSSERIRSSGSLRSSERIMQRAFDVRQSGTRNWPREIFANSDACSESLNGYLKWNKRRKYVVTIFVFDRNLNVFKSPKWFVVLQNARKISE